MKQPSLSPSIIAIFLLSLAYWLYLACTTSMQISCDAIGYHDLGSLINAHGWTAYFTTGPNREPLYPVLVAASMALEHITGFDYAKIMAIFGVMILFLTQILTYKILHLLNIRHGICILVLVYMTLSPALNNTAFSLYSEITAYPFILGIILTSFYSWEAIKNDKKYWAFLYCMLLGIFLTLMALIKGVFECIAPVYLIIFFSTIFLTDKETIIKRTGSFILCVVAVLTFFYIPITGYKYLNLHYNGNFAITGRASWMIYGSTVRRTELLNLKKFTEILAYVPGEGVCNSIFGQKECDSWTFQKTDELGLEKSEELSKQHLSNAENNNILLKLSMQNATRHPFQYTLLTAIEGLKMFFWESTKIGFVNYPSWLWKIYDIKIFDNVLRFFAFLISFIAIISLWRQSLTPQRSPIGFLVGILTFTYILFFSFVSILTRYALPIAPLYLIAVGIWLNQNLALKKRI